MVWAVAAMVVMIVAARPVAVAAGRRLGAEVPRRGRRPAQTTPHSWFLDLLRRSRLRRRGEAWRLRRVGAAMDDARPTTPATSRRRVPRRCTSASRRPQIGRNRRAGISSRSCCSGAPCGLAGTCWCMLPLRTWALLVGAGAADAGPRRCWRPPSARSGRCPPGSPSACRRGCRDCSSRWCRSLASFPAPMLFPLVIAMLHFAGVALGWGSVVLMLLGHAVVHPVQRHRRRDRDSRPICGRRRAAIASGGWQRFACCTSRRSSPTW